jgi:hypothetical protein
VLRADELVALYLCILSLKDALQMEFYAQMCRLENWSVRTLEKKIDSMLFERTAISKKPEALAKMELYLRWLEKHEMQPDEEKPIGLILCTEGNQEQIELMQLDAANIKVAEFITEVLPTELLKQKLHQFAVSSRKLIENRTSNLGKRKNV